MTGITNIKRDWGDSVSIVRIITTDSMATAAAANYILNQASNIVTANNGSFQWLANDQILVAASDGNLSGMISADFNSIIPLTFINQAAKQSGIYQGSGLVQSNLYANVAMTLANFTGMYATPFQIVAAPGAGKLLSLRRVVLYQTYGSAALTSGGVVGFQYGNTAHLAGTLCSNTEQAADFTGAVANTSYFFSPVSGNASQATDGSNLGIFISNQTGAFATGTGSSFNVHVWYDVITLP